MRPPDSWNPISSENSNILLELTPAQKNHLFIVYGLEILSFIFVFCGAFWVCFFLRVCWSFRKNPISSKKWIFRASRVKPCFHSYRWECFKALNPNTSIHRSFIWKFGWKYRCIDCIGFTTNFFYPCFKNLVHTYNIYIYISNINLDLWIYSFLPLKIFAIFAS